MLAYRKKLITAAEEEPVTLAEARNWLKMPSSTANDAIISGLISAARSHIEEVFSCALVSQTWDLYLDNLNEDGWREIRFHFGPIQSVTTFKYYYSNTAETWAAENYTLDTAGLIPRIGLNENVFWPSPDNRLNSVEIRVVAGYGAASAVHEDIKTAIKLLVAMWHENREDMPLNNNYGRAAYSLLRNKFVWTI